METSGKRFGDEPTGSSKACSYSRCFIQIWTRVQDFENVRMWSGHDVSIRFWQLAKQLAELSGSRGMKPLQESPVCRNWYAQKVIGNLVR